MERNSKGQFFKGGNIGHKRFGGVLFKKGHKDLVPKEKRGHTQVTKDKIRKTMLNTQEIGDKYRNWKGGISKIDRLCRRIREYLK